MWRLYCLRSLSGDYFFDEFWNTLSEVQQGLLLALAEERKPDEEEIKAAPVLLRKEILAQNNEGWSFRVQLIQHWLVFNAR